MIDFLLNAHAFCYGANERNHYKLNNRFLWGVTNVMSRLLQFIVFFCIRARGFCGIISSQRGLLNTNVVLSFTSFPARIRTVWMVVDSIFRQTMLPGKIQLWLSEEDFPKKENDLPPILLSYKDKGLEICWVKENLKPHKKYLYAFQKYPDKCVITIDDDIYYRNDLVERLWNLHKTFPNAVCGNRGGRVVVGSPYREWGRGYAENFPSHEHFLTGCGGIIYPVALFSKVCVNQPEVIRETSLVTDDLWLKTMELLNDVPVVIGKYYSNGPLVGGSQKSSLMSENCNRLKSNNDESWKRLNERFGVEKIITLFSCREKHLSV